MATPQAGVTGVIEIDGNAIANIREVSIEWETKDLDAGGFGNVVEEILPGRQKGKGSMKGVSVTGDPNGQAAVVTAFRNRTLVTITLGPASGNAGVYPSYILKVKEMTKFDGLAEFEADFGCSGSPTSDISHS